MLLALHTSPIPEMSKLLRILFGFLCVGLAAAGILAFLFAGFLVIALVSVWLREGRLTSEDIHILARAGEAMLIAGAVVLGAWRLGRHVFGSKLFSSSFKHVPSETGRTERLALSVSTVAMFAIISLWIYERTDGNDWLRVAEVLRWLLVIFFGLHIRVLLHELGHLSAAQILKMDRSKVQIGAGPLLWSFISRRGLRWEWRLWPQIGIVFAQNNRLRGFKRRQVIFTSAGPVADAFIVWGSYVLISRNFGGLFNAFAESAFGVVVVILFWLTTGSAINGLIPHRIHLGLQQLYTDGYWLCHLILASDKEAQEFIMEKKWEQLNVLAKQARIYLQTPQKR